MKTPIEKTIRFYSVKYANGTEYLLENVYITPEEYEDFLDKRENRHFFEETLARKYRYPSREIEGIVIGGEELLIGRLAS